MTIHWKAVEQYFTMVLFVNPLTPTAKPWVTQSFLSFDSMDRTSKCDRSLESCCAVLYCGAVCEPFDSQSETLGDTKFASF